MKRLIAALLFAAVALSFAASAHAAAYTYVWKQATWGSDTTSFYIPAGGSIAVKNSDIISLPGNMYWCAAADSIPQFIAVGTISAAGASTDTLMLDYQWTYDGVNYLPALDWDIDAQVHVGAGLYWSFRFLNAAGATPVYTAAGTGDWAAGVPNTYRFTIPAKGATGLRLVIHPSNAARTLNGRLRVKVGFPTLMQF